MRYKFERTRASIVATAIDTPSILNLPESCSFWYETDEEIARRLRWGREKARKLRWIRRQMRYRLGVLEQRCIMLHYVQGLTFREISTRVGTDAACVHRTVRRAVVKLRRTVKHYPGRDNE
jgi:DNA-directed RNA polymerase specialized sigma24 family protein